jgi:predicted ATP-dependent endonuclease of OLD family
MYLKKITLTNFKIYERLEFHCNNKFNIIIGENNIGKSTLYDALILWDLAYLRLIKKDKKGFYKKTNYNSMNINFTKFSIFRLQNISDLFKDTHEPAKIELTIVDSEATEYNLEIELNKPDIENAYIRFTNGNKLDDFNNFAMYCKDNNIRLHDAINIRLTKPISALLKQEPFFNKAQIKNKTYLGFSHEVLRNKILLTAEDRKFEYLAKKLENILGTKNTIRFKNDNRDDNEFINMTIQKDNERETDLLLVGSGILHILEIFSTIKSEQDNLNSVNLLLLDEPDSHIHADVQSKLIDELKNEETIQTFLITHNDRLMKKADDGELFYICQRTINSQILNSLSLDDYSVVSSGLSSLMSRENKPIFCVEDEYYQIYKIAYLKLKKITCTKDNFENLFNENAPFVIRTGKSAGGVAGLLRMKDSSLFQEKKIVGLFDFDREGRENYYHLKKESFWNDNNDGNLKEGYYKKRTDCENFYAMLLPIPEEINNLASLEWGDFISYIEIENLLPKEFLIDNNFVVETTAPGDIKYLKVKKTIKNQLWRKLFDLTKDDFKDFEPLYNRVNSLLGTE